MKLTCYRQTIRPRYRFATAQGGIDEKATLVVEFAHDGVVGRGECVPSRLYGQSIEASEAVVRDAASRLGDDPFAIGPIMDRLIERHDGQRAALAAVDSALHDWVGRKLGVSVRQLLGLGPTRTRTTFTLGIAEPDEMRIKLREALAAGFDALKVKVGSSHDEQTLGLIREHFDGPLLMDANEAWTPAEAPDRIRALVRFRPAMIEQPLPQDQWRHLGRLRELGVAAIFADESCQRPADVVKLHGQVDGVNIKFTKCGGIREALKMIHLARGLGMQVMLGCFVCSSLAIAPALALAALVDLADLDGHLLLAEDPFAGIRHERAYIELPDAPGLGVEPRCP